jgi:peptidoglycan/LPS O-acetylase OafA/YrhL
MTVRIAEAEPAGLPPPSTGLVRGATVVQAGERRSARIESIRALSALSVMVFHLWYIGHIPVYAQVTYAIPVRFVVGLRYGVFVFFALTGYLIFRPFCRHHFGDGAPVNVGRYLLNRALRILPLYWSVLALLLLTGADHGTPWLWWHFALFLENQARDTVFLVDGPMWSLVVEVEFYLLLPVFALALSKATRGRIGLAVVAVVGLGAASYVERYIHLYPVPANLNVFIDWVTSFAGNAAFFVPGMLVAFLDVAWQHGIPRWTRTRLGSQSLWLLTAVAVWMLMIWLQPGEAPLEMAVLATAFLVIGGIALPLRQGRLARILDWRPLAVLGVASYSLYLWHQPIILRLLAGGHLPTDFGVAVLVVGPMLVAVALASYALLEWPALRLRRRWAGRG